MALTRKRRAILKRRLADAMERMELYRAMEEKMLSGDVQSYSIGTRSLQRYSLSLSELQDMIEKLQDEIEELEAKLARGSARRAVAVVPRDW